MRSNRSECWAKSTDYPGLWEEFELCSDGVYRLRSVATRPPDRVLHRFMWGKP